MPRSLSEADINLQRILCKLPSGSSGSRPPRMEMRVGSGWGEGRSLSGVGRGDSPHPGPPSRWFPGCVCGRRAGPVPFLHTRPGSLSVGGRGGVGRVKAGCSRPQAHPRTLCCLCSECCLCVRPWVAPGGLHEVASLSSGYGGL